jgi:tetratricopeptide (TPR) repeat protein
MQELASQPRKVLEQPDDGGDLECAICLFCMAPGETASLPCGHMYHCECVKQLRERGVNDVCPQCRVRLPPGPDQCYNEAVQLTVRADRMCRQSSEEQARALWAQAAVLLEQVLQEEPGHRGAQGCLGHCFGKRGDFKSAVQWCRKAAEQGHAQAQFEIGVFYMNGKGGLCKDAGEAVVWFRKAAELGEASAQFILGWFYANAGGLGGVHKDMEKAVELYRKAAEQGVVQAQHALMDLGFLVDTAEEEEGGGGVGGGGGGKKRGGKKGKKKRK